MAISKDFIVKSGLVVNGTTTVPSTDSLVTTNVLRTIARPVIDFNFAKTATLDPRINFSRSSGATFFGVDGTIKYADVNRPRFEYDPNTGQCMGLLTEPAKTNLINIGSRLVPLSATLNTFPQPTTEVPALEQSSVVSKHFRYPTLTGDNNIGYHSTVLNSSTVYTVSAYVYIPAVTTMTSCGITVDGASFTQFNADLTKRDQWQRVYTTATVTVATSYALVLRPNGVTADGAYLYSTCWQLEAATSYPTSYIPTVGATVTRNGDAITVTGQHFNNWYNPFAGTLLIEDYLPGPRTSGPGFMAALYKDANNYFGLQYVAALGFYTGTNYCVVNGVGLQTDLVLGGNSNFNQYHKLALHYDISSYSAIHDGTVYLYTGTNYQGPPMATQLSIGGRAGSGTDFSGQGYIQRIKYWPTKLSTATMIAQTIR